MQIELGKLGGMIIMGQATMKDIGRKNNNKLKHLQRKYIKEQGKNNNMKPNLITHLKREGTKRGRRWVVKRDKDDNIREVKMIYNPEEYSKSKNPRPMCGDRVLIKILDDEKQKDNS